MRKISHFFKKFLIFRPDVLAFGKRHVIFTSIMTWPQDGYRGCAREDLTSQLNHPRTPKDCSTP